MFKSLPTSGLKGIDPQEFDFNKYTSNSSKRCVLEVDLKYPKELRKLCNDYPLALDKIEIKKENCLIVNQRLLIFIILSLVMLKNYFFYKEKYVLHYENLQLYLRLGLKIKKYITYYNSINYIS